MCVYGQTDVTDVKRQGRPRPSLQTLSHLQVEQAATLVTLVGSQTHDASPTGHSRSQCFSVCSAC